MNKGKERGLYLIKNTGILTLSNFSSKILIFLLVPLYTSVLTTAEYGAYDLAVSTATLMYPILTLNIIDAVMRFSMDRLFDKKAIASIGIKIISISIVIFGLGMYILNHFMLWPDINGLEALLFFYYISYVINQFLIQFAKGLEYVKEMGISGVISTLVMVFSNILFLVVFKWGLTGFFVANVLSQVVSVLYLALRIKIWAYLDIRQNDLQLQKQMLLYSIPLIATVVGWWVNSTSDKYIVSFMLGVSATGILSVSYKIPQIINTVQGIFIQAWSISAIKEYGEKDTKKFYGDTFLVINLLMCIASAWLIVFTRPLARLLYSKDFYVAWQFCPYLLISSILNCASGMIGQILAAQKNSKAMMWSAVIGASANIILNIALVYVCGIQGATIATVICSYIIYAVRKRAVVDDIIIKKYNKVLITWGLLFILATIEVYISNYVLEAIIMIVLMVFNINDIERLMNIGKNMFISLLTSKEK